MSRARGGERRRARTCQRARCGIPVDKSPASLQPKSHATFLKMSGEGQCRVRARRWQRRVPGTRRLTRGGETGYVPLDGFHAVVAVERRHHGVLSSNPHPSPLHSTRPLPQHVDPT